MTTSPTAAARKHKILVIDDETIILQVLTLHLRSADYDVVCAGSACDGINLLPSASFSLVITDYHLPDKNGLAVLSAVKSSKPDTPVIVISGFLDADLIAGILNAGAARYLKKPFLKTELLDSVAHILNAGQDA